MDYISDNFNSDLLVMSSDADTNEIMDALSGYFYWVPVYSLSGLVISVFLLLTTVHIYDSITNLKK